MSLVVFPFKQEHHTVVASNLATAAHHERVGEVWAVAAHIDDAVAPVVDAAREIETWSSVPVRVFPQERLGRLRPGKGDAMNTAIRRAAEEGFQRAHFYDADITNFDESWIDGAEQAADRGFGVVRHRFPRAATDAMVTWMITRPGLAKHFPGTFLPRLGQPLGGEILLGAEALQALADDPFVVARSDWGIDTVITYATATLGLDLYEHNAPDGKRHALYGSLTEIREMVLECLDAVASLGGRGSPPPSTFDSDPPTAVPEDLKRTVAYDMSATMAAVADPPDREELAVLESLSIDAGDLHEMDEKRWGRVLDDLMENFALGERPWESAVFRLWVTRVIHYTKHHVSKGYDHAVAYLEQTIRDYEISGYQD